MNSSRVLNLTVLLTRVLPDDGMRAAITEQPAFVDGATDRHHRRGTKIIPFSTHNVDEVPGDLGVDVPARVRASHCPTPVTEAAG